MNTTNPYNWQRVDPNMFFGRIDLANDLVHQLVGGHSFGITGGRKMGKTTLLRRVEKDLLAYSHQAQRGGLLVLPIYIETGSISFDNSPDLVFQAISDLLAKVLYRLVEISFSNDRPVNRVNFSEYLLKIIDTCQNYRPQIILLFDEVEPITKMHWGRSFFANWRSLLHNTPNLSEYVSAVFAGSSEMFEIAKDIGSPLGNVLTWRELELFNQEDTKLLMTIPSQQQWTYQFITDVYNMTGGHPFLIQYMMSFVHNSSSRNPNEALTQARIKFITEQNFLFQNWLDKFGNTAAAIYSQIMDRGAIQRAIILSEFGSSANRSLSILSHTGVVRIDNVSEMAIVAGDLFQEWFRKFGAISITPTLADHVDSLLKKTERQMRHVLAIHIDNKYKPDWLQKRITSSSPEQWKEILKRARVSPESFLNNGDVLKNLDLGDLFDIFLLGTEWTDLSTKFVRLSRDTKKARFRFEERKDHLVFVRNKLRHVNEDQLEAGDLLKAQAFCAELLECID
ncbi:AAA-like domain-containing protein [Kouleothrix sp.]|uniref:AAA-like domain-containing protein n=1 Tax=Kouleothrix sp. TaxID=2779161 RepID=UPI00391BB8B9